METKVTSSMSLGEIVARHPQCRGLFETLGLDYCCGGKQRLSEAATAAGKNPEEVLARINQAIESRTQAEEKDFLAMSLSDLAVHIEHTHHVFMRQQLPRLSALLEKVQQAHSQRHGRMLYSLQQIYAVLRAELGKRRTNTFPLYPSNRELRRASRRISPDALRNRRKPDPANGI